ncbi:MAG TPA: gas vesicle protein GvpJ [Thermoleophilaceae bacterium]|nr:gas vesicle protein GvpJ [Thermoleophilaceae bacterium]
MAIATAPRGGYLERPRPSGLADVIDVILDKGLVIDAYVRVSLVGIELLTIDARIVIASVDTYLRFAEAVNRLDIAHDDTTESLPELVESMTSGGASSKAKGAIEGVKDALTGGDDDDDDSGGRSRSRSRASSRSRSASSSSGSRSGSSSSGSRSRSRKKSS